VAPGTGEPLKPSQAQIHGGIDSSGASFTTIIQNKPESSYLRTGEIVEPGQNVTWLYDLPATAKEGQLRIGKLPPIPLRL
jgi:hypothetical protein